MTRFVALGGFLGAGKTTAMIRAAVELRARGETVAVVTNDQGEDLVDTAMSRDAGPAAAAEITGGCFCCRFDELAEVVDGLLDTHRPTVVVAEAVGSCTDLQSTVLRPLRALRGGTVDVAPLVVLVDPDRYRTLRDSFGADGADASDLAHLYHHQLAESDVLALNKIDSLDDATRDALLDDLAQRFPHARVLGCAAATGAGFDELLGVWTGAAPDERPRPFAVDYDRYGAAEAELAWTNQVVELSGAFVPDDWLAALLADLGERLAGAFVGHVKVRVATADACAKASLVTGDGPVQWDVHARSRTARATALVNARVGVEPEHLDELLADAVRAADAACATASRRVRGRVFRPGFPVPVHRM